MTRSKSASTQRRSSRHGRKAGSQGETRSWYDESKLKVPGHQQLWRLHQALREEIRDRWQRGLPFNEELFDRWERARFLDFGKGTSVYDSCVVLGDVTVGKKTWIGPFTVLDGSGGLSIGDNCSISSGVQIYTHDTTKWALSGGKAGYDHAAVRIGNNCYIGPHAVIASGVTVGDRSLVGACSFVNRSIPPNTVAFGIPCKHVGHVEVDAAGNVSLMIAKRRRGAQKKR